jgi:hypothetical protein
MGLKIEKPLVVLHKSSRGRILGAATVSKSYELDSFLSDAALQDGDVLEFSDADQREADPPGDKPIEIGGLADEGTFRRECGGFDVRATATAPFGWSTATDTIHR